MDSENLNPELDIVSDKNEVIESNKGSKSIKPEVSKSQILKEAGLKEPESNIAFVNARIKRVSVDEVEFFALTGNFARSEVSVKASASLEKAKHFNIQHFADNQSHLLKVRFEQHIESVTGYVDSNNKPVAHKKTYLNLAEVIEEGNENDMDFVAITQVDRTIVAAKKYFRALTGRDYNYAPEDNDLYFKCLNIQ
jgi:hypothetical protein